MLTKYLAAAHRAIPGKGPGSGLPLKSQMLQKYSLQRSGVHYVFELVVHGPLAQSLSPQDQVPRLLFFHWALPPRARSGGRHEGVLAGWVLSRGGTALVPAGARGGEAPACKTCIAG